MKTWVPLILPIILLFALMLLLVVYPAASLWPQYTYFPYIPYFLFAVGMLFGVFFTQTRVSFLCLLLTVITYLVSRSFFEQGDVAKGATVIFLAAIYVPSFTVLLYHLSERGLFTSYGYVRAALLFSAILVIFLLPQLRPINEALLSAQSPMFRPLCDWCRIPPAGLLFFLVCTPPMFIRNKHESPVLGKIMCSAMLFVLGSLNFRAGFWKPEDAQSVFLSFMSAAGLSLVWAVMESSWRSAHIDELTELPGRRALKHHLARLSGDFVIAIADIDFFKKINDKYGHDTGDQVLRFIAAHLKEKAVGKVYRYGGEEFVIVCDGSDCQTKLPLFDELRKSVEDRKFWLRGKDRPRKKPEKPQAKPATDKPTSINITISIGVAENNEKHPSPQDVLEAADKALYRAKEAGRNCVKATR